MEDFKILQKAYDMILYGLVCLKQFPKSERYGLAEDIRQTMYSLLRLIITANKKYFKQTTLQDLDTELEKLRVLIRIAADPKFVSERTAPCLPRNKYENWSKMLSELGKMIGGWIKSTKK